MPNIEQRARNAAKRACLIAIKSRRRRGTADNHGGFQLLDNCNRIIAGECLDLTAEDVITYCHELQQVKEPA